MRDADLKNMTELLRAAERGELSRTDVVALLILMREISVRGSVLRDVADGVAHDVRDKGLAFKTLSRFARTFVQACLRGGQFEVEVIYPIEELLKNIVGASKAVGVVVSPLSLHAHREALISVVASALDGTEFIVNRMVEVGLSASDNPAWTFRTLYPVQCVDGSLLFPGGAIAGPLFKEFPEKDHWTIRPAGKDRAF